MKLSEAMRLGSMQLPAISGPVFSIDADGSVCGACAIGAAMFASGVRDYLDLATGRTVVGGWLPLNMRVPFPVGTFSVDWELLGVIITLFEHHRWTREQIADWVESIERQEAAKLSEMPAEVVRA